MGPQGTLVRSTSHSHKPQIVLNDLPRRSRVLKIGIPGILQASMLKRPSFLCSHPELSRNMSKIAVICLFLTTLTCSSPFAPDPIQAACAGFKCVVSAPGQDSLLVTLRWRSPLTLGGQDSVDRVAWYSNGSPVITFDFTQAVKVVYQGEARAGKRYSTWVWDFRAQ
jgi:hypothetical protein